MRIYRRVMCRKIQIDIPARPLEGPHPYLRELLVGAGLHQCLLELRGDLGINGKRCPKWKNDRASRL